MKRIKIKVKKISLEQLKKIKFNKRKILKTAIIVIPVLVSWNKSILDGFRSLSIGKLFDFKMWNPCLHRPPKEA